MSATHDAPSHENLDDFESKETDHNYQFPIPIKGDHWRDCFDILLKEDKDRYEVWKDEIQNLLIFAGLFSAVVTAFAIASYPSLQADPNQTMILLLSQISSRLDNSTTSATSANIPPFVPSSASVRINIYWFLSLLLSLTTVLIGIITLQWLREYQRYKNNVTSKRAFAQRNMRFESLKVWHVNHILTGLPLLLQAALLLFIIGIIEFLIDLSKVVAIPCIVIAALTLIFHAYTTVSPAFQYYWYQLENDSREFVPAPPPCPYKSPQAWAFFSCTQVPGISHIWRTFLNTIHLVYRLTRTTFFVFPGKHKGCRYKGSINFSLLSESTVGAVESHRLPLSNWNNIDLIWLRRRHAHDFANNYDAARGLARILQLHSHLETVAFSSYHCFSEIALKDGVRQDVIHHMTVILQDGESKSMSWTGPDRTAPLSKEEALIGFLNFLPQSSPKNPRHSLIWKHQTELLIKAHRNNAQSHIRSQVSQSGMEDAREFILLPRFVKEIQYTQENLGRWDDALKEPLKELHQHLLQTENLDPGSSINESRMLGFLEKFSPQRKSTTMSAEISRQVFHGIAEVEKMQARSGQDLHTAHAHFEVSREHIEISVPPSFVEGFNITEMEERELEARTEHPKSTNSEPQKPTESFLSPHSQLSPDNSHSRSHSPSTLPGVFAHGTIDMA